MSHIDAKERDKMLEDLIKDSKRELEATIISEKVRLDNHIKQEKTKFTQKLFDRFNEEIKQLQEYLKWNYSDVCTHYVTANWLNKELKDRGF
jgi:uncharacterized FlaG/YvyC family protein